tara:strand:- start:196 stop:1113 length:918 start_codon:yes stop_codon:yes gene_type:complete
MSNDIINHRSSGAMMQDSKAIESYKDFAKLMSQAQVQIPAHFKGKPADCLAVVMQAARWQMDPFVVAQKTFVINGTLGYEAQLINSVVSSSNVISSRFKYEYLGEREDWRPKWTKENRGGKDIWKPQFSQNACARVGAVITGEDDITWGEWVYPCDQQVFNSPLWKTNPKQQVGYLAVKFWARFYTPDVLLGAYTPDELHDYSERDITPSEDMQESKRGGAFGKLKAVDQEVEDIVVENHSEAINIDKSMDLYSGYKYLIKDQDDVELLRGVRVNILAERSLTDFDLSALLDLVETKIEKLEQET